MTVRSLWADEAGPLDAPLIVLVHGAMDRSAGLLPLSRQLDDRFRVARYDRRGYGRSAPHAGPFTMEAQVDDLLHVIAERDVLVVGHSFGGNVALAAAARRPDLVHGVAVYESPLSWEPWWPRPRDGATALAGQADPGVAAEHFLRRMIGHARWEALPPGTQQRRRSEGVTMVAEIADLRERAPWTAAELKMPLLTGNGEHGQPRHRQGMSTVAELVPGARWVTLAGCAHDAPRARAQQFAREIVEPLAEMVGGQWAAALRDDRR